MIRFLVKHRRRAHRINLTATWLPAFIEIGYRAYARHLGIAVECFWAMLVVQFGALFIDMVWMLADMAYFTGTIDGHAGMFKLMTSRVEHVAGQRIVVRPEETK